MRACHAPNHRKGVVNENEVPSNTHYKYILEGTISRIEPIIHTTLHYILYTQHTGHKKQIL